ncbi:Protein of unknown function [Bacillus mycoides]|nr:Protein of unknown function [Bacillus mycoides]
MYFCLAEKPDVAKKL